MKAVVRAWICAGGCVVGCAPLPEGEVAPPPAPPARVYVPAEVRPLEGRQSSRTLPPIPAPPDAPVPPAIARPAPALQAVLDEWVALGGGAPDATAALDARTRPTLADAVLAVARRQGRPADPEAVAEVRDDTLPVRSGRLAMRLYVPTSTQAPRPAVLFVPDGVWVRASLDAADATARALANASQALVVMALPRQAPEHPFPAAHEDVIDAWRWLVAQAGSLGADPRKLAIAGETTGGNLAAAVTLTARDNALPMPAYVLLVTPVLGADFTTPSYAEHAQARPLGRATMQWAFTQYLRSPADREHPLVAIGAMADAGRWPPTTVLTAGIDPLHDEGVRFVQRLRAAGVSVVHRDYPDMTNGFFGTGRVVETAADAVRQAGADLDAAFRRIPAP